MVEERRNLLARQERDVPADVQRIRQLERENGEVRNSLDSCERLASYATMPRWGEHLPALLCLLITMLCLEFINNNSKLLC